MMDGARPDFVEGHRPSLLALTGLQFLAEIAMVLSHFSASGFAPVPARLVYFIDGGRTAVCLFFVLSGLVQAFDYPALIGRVQQWFFDVARLARIYPVVVLGVALGAVGRIFPVSRPNLLFEWFALKSRSLPGGVATMLASVAVFRWYETPLRRAIRGRFRRPVLVSRRATAEGLGCRR